MFLPTFLDSARFSACDTTLIGPMSKSAMSYFMYYLKSDLCIENVLCRLCLYELFVVKYFTIAFEVIITLIFFVLFLYLTQKVKRYQSLSLTVVQ